MKKEIKNKQQVDLFDPVLYESIKEDEIKFPLFFKNKSNTIYTCYFDVERFEQISITQENEPYLCSIIFGFNGQMIQCKGDLKSYFYILYRNQIEIHAEEYEEVFKKTISNRNNFFNTNDYQYLQRELTDRQKNIKHKWKPIEL